MSSHLSSRSATSVIQICHICHPNLPHLSSKSATSVIQIFLGSMYVVRVYVCCDVVGQCMTCVFSRSSYGRIRSSSSQYFCERPQWFSQKRTSTIVGRVLSLSATDAVEWWWVDCSRASGPSQPYASSGSSGADLLGRSVVWYAPECRGSCAAWTSAGRARPASFPSFLIKIHGKKAFFY